MAKKTLLIPWDKKGNMLSWTMDHPDDEDCDTDFREGKPFSSKMRIIGADKGRSSFTYYLQDEVGRRYPIMWQRFNAVLQECTINKGVIERSDWVYIKRGANYSLALAGFEK